MSRSKRIATGLVAGGLIVSGALGTASTATAGTKPPPCTKAAVKKALKALTPTLPPDAQIVAFTKMCKGYWAGGGYEFKTPDGGSGSSSYLLQASGGNWKLVPFSKKVDLCDKGALPKKLSARICRMAP
jgi:hypothetical protein